MDDFHKKFLLNGLNDILNYKNFKWQDYQDSLSKKRYFSPWAERIELDCVNEASEAYRKVYQAIETLNKPVWLTRDWNLFEEIADLIIKFARWNSTEISYD